MSARVFTFLPIPSRAAKKRQFTLVRIRSYKMYLNSAKQRHVIQNGETYDQGAFLWKSLNWILKSKNTFGIFFS